MAERSTAGRVASYLERRISCFEEVLEELMEFEHNPSEAGWDDWVARQQRRSQEMENLEREHGGLLREWRAATDASPAQRRAVRLLAARAETLRDLVLKGYARAAELLAHRMQAEAGDLASLRKGQDLLHRYRAVGAPPHDFLDRKA